MEKILGFLKKYLIEKKLIYAVIGLVLAIVIICTIVNKTSVNKLKTVRRVLFNNYYKVDCMNTDCDYIIAYKGNIVGKSKIVIYNAEGKKIASYKEIFNADKLYVRNIAAVNKNYIIFDKTNISDNKSAGYSIATTKGKEKYTTENRLVSLNNYLISEKLEESYNVLNTNGKVLYTKVSDIDSYADGKYLSLNIKNEDIILNEKGEKVLDGFKIVKQVKDSDNNALYFVLQDSDKNAYYYYNIKNNKVSTDSFNSYIDGSNEGELIITKKINNDYIKYVLNAKGKTKKISDVSLEDLKDIDINKYTVMNDSYILKNQLVVLVTNKEDNSFGVYNIKTNKYVKLLDGAPSRLSKLLSNEKELYIGLSYASDDTNKLVVYDMVNDKKIYELNSKDFNIVYYTNYGDYNVVKYSSSSSDEYRNKYAVYDSKNKEVFRSDNQIVIVDKNYNFGKEYDNYSLVLFSAKTNKALNNSENLANKVSLGESYFYKFSDSEKTYLYNEHGEKLKTINNSTTSFMYSNDSIIYINNGKAFIINPKDNKTRTYRFKLNERMNSNEGDIIPPYKNALFINNTVNSKFKVVNINGRTIKKVNKQVIETVKYNKKSGRVIIITKKIKKNNSLYGLYIGK